MGSRIEQLIARIRDVKTKQEQSDLVGALSVYAQQATEVEQKLCRARSDAERLEQVFGDSEAAQAVLERAAKARRQAVRPAKRLQKILTEDVTAVKDGKTETAIQGIKDAASDARRQLSDGWAQLLRDKVFLVMTGLELGAATGSATARQLIAEVRAAATTVEIPANAASAATLAAVFAGAEEEIQSLSLSGPAESFLKQAMAGQGDPQALFLPEVKKFLDDKKLWKRLKVKLG